LFLVELKKKEKQFILQFIYCRRLNSQYFGAPKSGGPQDAGSLHGCEYCASGPYATAANSY